MPTKTLSSETIYSGKIFDVRIDRIREGSAEYNREIVVHPGSAVIVPIFEDETVALVKQYRHAAREYLLELPAGALNKGESPEAAARRELEEEIGVTAANIEKLTEFYVSPGFLTEKMHIYLATGLTETAQNLDEDEFVEIVRIPLTKALALIRTAQIQDAKTIIGLTLANSKGQKPDR